MCFFSHDSFRLHNRHHQRMSHSFIHSSFHTTRSHTYTISPIFTENLMLHKRSHHKWFSSFYIAYFIRSVFCKVMCTKSTLSHMQICADSLNQEPLQRNIFCIYLYLFMDDFSIQILWTLCFVISKAQLELWWVSQFNWISNHCHYIQKTSKTIKYRFVQNPIIQFESIFSL